METTQTQTSSKNWIYILTGLIVLLLGANAYLYLNKSEKETQIIRISDEKSALQLKLNELKADLEKANGTNTTLNTDLDAQKVELSAKIEELERALRNGKLTAAQLSRTKSEINELKNTINQYVADIAQLKQENEVLASENSTLKTTVESANTMNSELTNKNSELSNTVTKASMLKAQGVTASVFRRKSSGKLVDATRAKQVDKLVANINIIPNELAVEGPYLMYMQIVDPSGKLITSVTEDTNKALMINGEKIDYSTSTSISYARNNSNYAIEWLSSEGWVPGAYKINIYSDNALLGSSTFTLK